MKIAGVCFSVLLCTVLLFALQGPFERGRGMNAAPTDQVQAFLSLSDQQLQDLKTVQSSFRDAAAPLMQKIGEKMRALREAVEQDPDSALVTQLKAELADLRTQEQNLRLQYRLQAEAMLTSQQKTKLALLQQALDLMPVVRQATGLNLLDAPRDFPGGPGGARGGGPSRLGGLRTGAPPKS